MGRATPDEERRSRHCRGQECDVEVSAININGSVDVHLRPGERVGNAEFHFIQLVTNMVSYSLFLGSAPDDGAISVNFAGPPAFPKKFAYDFALDSLPDRLPYTNLRDPAIFPKLTNRGAPVSGTSTIVTDMDDHPSARMKVAVTNRITKKLNFLAEAQTTKLFLTAFVTRETTTKRITPLAYVTWQIDWKAMYRWVKGRCLPVSVAGSSFNVGKTEKGSPEKERSVLGRTGASMAFKITNPTTDPDETGNALDRQAHKALDVHPEIWNLDYRTQWPVAARPGFWTP
jgi:hypothetical protein